MADQKSLNFNHSTGTISTNDDSVVSIKLGIRTINDKKYEYGGLLIGDGTNPKLKDSEGKLEEGLLSVKDNKMYQSNKNGEWELIGEPYDDGIDIIYTLIMSH